MTVSFGSHYFAEEQPGLRPGAQHRQIAVDAPPHGLTDRSAGPYARLRAAVDRDARESIGEVNVVNVRTCQPDELIERGRFRAGYFDLTERLGASFIGATVYEMQAGDPRGPYHYHHGVEEWLYVVSGAPVVRDAEGERSLEPGELVAFAAGPAGAHTMLGPGRVVMFSAGARGWGEAFVTVYPDSDKIGAAPGVMFRRADAIDSWRADATASPGDVGDRRSQRSASPSVNLTTLGLELSGAEAAGGGGRVRAATLGARLGAQTWSATLYELAPGDATAPYHYEWCRESWGLVVSGTATLRHHEGETELASGDICCFPQGPDGAHGLRNDGHSAARLIVWSTATERPMSAFYPDDDAVVIRISNGEGFRFRHSDRIEDYWDGEPGAG